MYLTYLKLKKKKKKKKVCVISWSATSDKYEQGRMEGNEHTF